MNILDKLISIVLPVYNGAEFLNQSIDSIISQTYTNWELLVLDDCSTDNTPNIVKEYVKKDSRIHYYRNEQNLKLPGNLNKGFSLSKGDYLTWTSDDNMFHHNALEVMYKTITSQKVDLVYASYNIIDEKGNVIKYLLSDKKWKQHIIGSNVVGACFMYSKKVYYDIGEYDDKLFWLEDLDYWQRVLSKYEAYAISDILYDYRWHKDSLTATKDPLVYGQRLEKMLLKNCKLYGKMDSETKYFFYKCLAKSYEYQSKAFPYKNKLRLYSTITRIKIHFEK